MALKVKNTGNEKENEKDIEETKKKSAIDSVTGKQILKTYKDIFGLDPNSAADCKEMIKRYPLNIFMVRKKDYLNPQNWKYVLKYFPEAIFCAPDEIKKNDEMRPIIQEAVERREQKHGISPEVFENSYDKTMDFIGGLDKIDFEKEAADTGFEPPESSDDEARQKMAQIRAMHQNGRFQESKDDRESYNENNGDSGRPTVVATSINNSIPQSTDNNNPEDKTNKNEQSRDTLKKQYDNANDFFVGLNSFIKDD